ncbi:MAG: hypothetical protein R3B06_16320 [Kofleriaceae bacterium]
MQRRDLWFGLMAAMAAAGCGGATKAATPGNRGGGEAVDLATLADAARPVIVAHGQPYLYLEFVEPWGADGEPTAVIPSCWSDGSEEACPATVPAPADVVARLPTPPATLTVVTPTGLCQATVGPVELVDTHGCEPSGTYAARLTGCGTAVAPIGFAATDVPTLAWRPVTSVAPTPLPASAAALTDPLLRELATTWLAMPGMNHGQRHDATSTVVEVDAGRERFSTLMVTVLQGDSADQCDWEVAGQHAVGLRRGDQLIPVEVPDIWDGVLTHDGRVVAVVTDAPFRVVAQTVDDAGKLGPLLDVHVWSDNEECTQQSWSGIEYPCGL